MGSRLALPVLLLLALLASAGFWWFSSSSSKEGTTLQTERVLTPVAEGGASDLARPEGVEATPETPAASGAREVVVASPASEPAASQRGPARGPRVRGRVVDSLGNPIPGATVVSTNHPGFPLDLAEGDEFSWVKRFTAETDADGWFELSGPPPGLLRLGVRSSGYAPFEKRDIPLPDDELVELEPIALTRGAILSGRVFDADGRSVQGAELVALESDNAGMGFFQNRRRPLAVTGSDGGFRVDQLACGAWKILVRSDDHPDGVFEGLAERAGQEVSGLELVLRAGTTITGSVSGIPEEEAGLEVRAMPVRNGAGDISPTGPFGGSRTAEVDAQGGFTVSGLVLGEDYELSARLAEPDRGFFGRSRSEKIRARAGDSGVQVPYQPEAALAFQVFDATTRRPLEEFEVEAGIRWPEMLRGPDNRPLTFHPEGMVRVGELRPRENHDRVELAVIATGYEEYRVDDIVLGSGQEIDLGAIYLQPVPVVTVTVLDAVTGAPIEGARVELEKQAPGGNFEMRRTVSIDMDTDTDHAGHFETGDAHSSRTDAEGVAEVTSIQGETCTLTVRAREYADFELTGLFLPDGESVEQRVRLSRGGEALVTVLDPEGAPVPGARVKHRSPRELSTGAQRFMIGGGPAKDVTDSEGRVRFRNLEPGTHAFMIAASGGGGQMFIGEGVVEVAGMADDPSSSEWSRVAVVEGETAELVLLAPARGELAGRVREAGIPLSGATLSLAKAGAGGPFGGRISLPGMGGGLEARTDGSGNYRFEGVEEGRYQLTVTHPTRRMSAEFEVDVEPGENDLDLELSVAIVAGRITDMDGEPLVGLRVRAERDQPEVKGGPEMRGVMIMVEDTGGDAVVSFGDDAGGETVHTDQDGRYTLRGVVPDMDIVVKAEGSDVQPGRSEVVNLRPDEVLDDLDFDLEAGGAIEVEALLPDGSPAGFCLVSASYAGEESVEDQMGFIQSGSTTLRGLRPGPWMVRVNPAGSMGDEDVPPVEAMVQVKAGETARKTVNMP